MSIQNVWSRVTTDSHFRWKFLPLEVTTILAFHLLSFQILEKVLKNFYRSWDVTLRQVSTCLPALSCRSWVSPQLRAAAPWWGGSPWRCWGGTRTVKSSGSWRWLSGRRTTTSNCKHKFLMENKYWNYNYVKNEGFKPSIKKLERNVNLTKLDEKSSYGRKLVGRLVITMSRSYRD